MFLVVNNKPNASEKAHEVLSGMPKKSQAEVWSTLMGMSGEMQRAEGLDSGELVSEVMDTVWGDLPMHSRESAVLEELIQRFKTASEDVDAVNQVSRV